MLHRWVRAGLDLQAPHYFACLGFQPQSCSAPDFCQGSAAGLLPSTSTDAGYLDHLWTEHGKAWVSAAQQASAHGEYQVGIPWLMDPAASARCRHRDQQLPAAAGLAWCLAPARCWAQQTTNRLSMGGSASQLPSRRGVV